VTLADTRVGLAVRIDHGSVAIAAWSREPARPFEMTREKGHGETHRKPESGFREGQATNSQTRKHVGQAGHTGKRAKVTANAKITRSMSEPRGSRGSAGSDESATRASTSRNANMVLTGSPRVTPKPEVFSNAQTTKIAKQ